VRELRVKEGERVRAGQQLAILDGNDQLQLHWTIVARALPWLVAGLAQVKAGAKNADLAAPHLIEHSHLFAPRSDDDLAGDPASIIAGKKSRGWSDVVRLSDASERSFPVLLFAKYSFSETGCAKPFSLEPRTTGPPTG
jgi:hypothetical protein